MTTKLKISLIAAAAFLFAGTGFAGAQQKFGYINTQELISAMPETEAMQTQLGELSKELELQFEAMRSEYSTKVQDYSNTASTLSETIRKQKEKDLMDLQSRLEEFSQSASEEISNKQTELLQPIIEKAQNAINTVGKEQNLIAIFDLTSGAIPYHNESAMVDVLPMVKKSLGL